MSRDIEWFKSSYSAAASDNCVEVRWGSMAVQARDSRNPADEVLVFTPAAWGAFLHAVQRGEL